VVVVVRMNIGVRVLGWLKCRRKRKEKGGEGDATTIVEVGW